MAFTIGRVGRAGYAQVTFRAFGTDTDGTLNAWTQVSGVWTISSNVGTSPAGIGSLIYAGQSNWGDLTFNLRVKWATSVSLGALVHADTVNANWIQARIDGANLHIDKGVGGVYTPDVIAQTAAALVNGNFYWLRIGAVGTTYTIQLFNDSGGLVGTQVGSTMSATIADASVQTGFIGVRQGATTGFTFGGAFANVCTVDALPPTLVLPDPMSWHNASYGSAIKGQGGDVVVSGMISGLTASQALVLRDQLLGYQDNGDEPIVPVVVDSEPRLTGYYAVTGVEVETDPTAVGLGILSYTVGLQPVQGFAQPMVEAVMSGALLTNVVGAAVGDLFPFHSVPGVNTEYYHNAPPNAFTTRTSADGAMQIAVTNTGGTAWPNTIGRFGLTPANFYPGAATFEQGSPLHPVPGRNILLDNANWRISNGFIRITPNASASKLDFSFFGAGAVWSAPKTFTFSVPTLSAWTSVAVLRNAVEEVIVRLTAAAGTNAITTVDISLRRGDRLARILRQTAASVGALLANKIAVATAEAATAITFGAVTLGGISATANDAYGNRYVLLSYQQAVTSDLVNGALACNAVGASMDIGIGYTVGADSSPNTAVQLAQQYITAQTEEQRVVAR